MIPNEKKYMNSTFQRDEKIQQIKYTDQIVFNDWIIKKTIQYFYS